MMATRFMPLIAAAAGFVVTLALAGWHDGLWERSLPPPLVVAETAPPVVPAPRPAVKADSPAVQPEVSDPVPASVPLPAETDDGSPAAAADSDVPPDAERELPERQREGRRSARTR
jgi:hypothetical protein